jgi:hypothetical protein
VLRTARRSSETTPTYSKMSVHVNCESGCRTDCICAGVELVKKPLIPGIHAILQDVLYNFEQSCLSFPRSAGQFEIQDLHQLLGQIVINQGSSWLSTLDRQTTTCWFDRSILICRANEWNYKFLDGVEKLRHQ